MGYSIPTAMVEARKSERRTNLFQRRVSRAMRNMRENEYVAPRARNAQRG
jgi:predicted transcriptional regulator